VATRLTGFARLFDVMRSLGFVSVGRAAVVNGFAADDGQSIPVQVYGHGPPIVLLHGLGCSHRHWRAVARRLARRNTVFAWDARGHGQCRPVTGEGVSLPRLGRDLANLLDAFELERVVLVGHSMGALTVLRYLQDFGTVRALAVCLVDQSPRVVTDDEWRLGLFGGCSAAMLSGVIEAARQDFAATVMRELNASAGQFLARMLSPDSFAGRRLHAWLRGLPMTPFLDLCASLVDADFRPLLQRMNVPLMVVLGGRSAHYQNVPLEPYYKQTVPGVEVHVYERSGHSPHFAEAERFARDLAEFVDAVD
jgi:pimeloyl-ACP methyl ester carboxylesterase